MIAIILTAAAALPIPSWEPVDAGVTTSIRGLHAVDARTCWLGTQGGVARTVDAGKSWKFFKIGEEGDELDFRDVEAFDARRCVAMSAGTGEASRIYRTEDGGESWDLVFQNREPKGFFNGVAFREDGHGVLAGDPIDGRLYLLATEDHGKTWRRLAEDDAPEMEEGEHSFAASGTHVAVSGRFIWVATGGSGARIFVSFDWGGRWSFIRRPASAKAPSRGIFSIAVAPDGSNALFAVGGDYEKETEALDTALFSPDGGKSWKFLKTAGGDGPFPFRSCVGYVDATTLVAVGPSGSDLSRDGGRTWRPLGGEGGFHTVSVAGGVAWAAGAEGRVGRLVLSKP